MTWFKVDDTLAFHHKVIAAGNAAMGLWVRAGAMCAAQLTDGFVPRRMARQMGTAAEARRLVDAGLWVEVDGGYRFHEWHERQPTRAEVEDRRAKRAEAGRLGGLKSRPRPHPQPVDEPGDNPPPGEASTEANASPPLLTRQNPRPGPARPGYLLTLVGRLAVGDARASTSPPAEQIDAWQDIAGPAVDLEAEAAAYLARHGDRPAADERAAWLGWLREARRRAPAAPRPPCDDAACAGGWLPADEGGRPVPCPACKPHVRAVSA